MSVPNVKQSYPTKRTIQAGRGNALPAKIFSVNLDDLYIQGDKGKLTKVRE